MHKRSSDSSASYNLLQLGTIERIIPSIKNSTTENFSAL